MSILSTLAGGCRCVISWYDLDFVLAVTLTLKSCFGYNSVTVRCRKVIFVRDIGWGCRCATSWCDLDLIFGLVVVTLTLKILSG